jgi:prepilin-type N-terminal cleavage/methylation domain-containing protein
MFRRSGFTLVEVLVVIGIFACVIVLLVPAVRKARDNANRTATQNNLRELGVAVHTAVGDYKRLPPTDPSVDTGNGVGLGVGGAYGKVSGNLPYHLLPYLQQRPLYVANQNVGYVDAFVPPYHAPCDMTDTFEASATTTFCYPCNTCVFNQGGNTVGKNLSTSMPDGTSSVIMFATGTATCTTTPAATGGRVVYRNSAALFNNGAAGTTGPASNDTTGGHFGVGPLYNKAFTQTCDGLFQVPGLTPSPATGTMLGVFLPSQGGDATQWQTYDAAGIWVCMGDANVRLFSASVSGKTWIDAVITNNYVPPGGHIDDF